MSDTTKTTPLSAAEQITKDGMAADCRHQGQMFCDFMSALTSCKLHDKADIAQVMAHMASMLTAPLAPELAEAFMETDSRINSVSYMLREPDTDDVFARLRIRHVRTILRHARAQQPGLTEEQREAVRGLDAATRSHVDGRDLLAELHPRNMLDIIRRVDGVETRHQGDWLSTLMNARNKLRAAFPAAFE